MRATIRLSLPLLVVASMIAAATPGSAAPCNVPSPSYPDIQTAEDDPTCDPIIVAAGQFGPVAIDRSLTLQGAGAGATFIEGTAGSPGIAALTGTPTISITGVTIRNGTWAPGAGIQTNAGIALNLTGSIVEQNHAAGEVGGIYNGGTMTIRDSIIRDNSSTGRGGGIQNDGTLTIVGSTIAGNTTGPSAGGHGAGIYLHDPNDPTLTMVNSTLSGNKAVGSGGGIYGADSMTLNNVTITDNTADEDANGVGEGGGIFRLAGTLTLSNTIIGGNQDKSTGADPQHPDCSGEVVSTGYNLIENVTGCTITGTATGNVLNQNPQLEPLRDNGGLTETHALKQQSAAVDAGNPAAPGSGGSACAPADQRGVTRPQGPRCDIGSFELQLQPPPPGVEPKCLGKKVTIIGTDGSDTILGTKKADAISSLGGDDVIDGLGAGDRVCAGDGNDQVKGRSGDDQVRGQAGNDTVRSGSGGDTVKGGAGNDRLRGQSGDDILKGGGSHDRINGGGGFDLCRGGPGPDRVRRCES